MNDLVPFEFEGLKAAEAVWIDPRSVRFPRSEVGRLFRADHGCHSDTHDTRRRRPQNLVQVLIKRHPQLADLGIPLAVRGMIGTQGDREYTAVCYSLDEIYQLAIHSTLPGARRLLHIYPRLKEAEILGRFTRMAPKDARESYAVEKLNELLALPRWTKARLAVRDELMQRFGKSKGTIWRWGKKRSENMIPPLRKGRSDKGKFRKFPEPLRAKLLTRLREDPDISTMDLWRLVENQATYSTVCRWRRSFDSAQDRQIEAKEIAA